MKRVVILEAEQGLIDFRDCTNNGVYIAQNKRDEKEWGIIISRKLDDDFKLFPIYHSITYGNTYGKDEVIHTIVEAIHYYSSSWNFYQFPDFRSAMQYYLEQTK